MTQQQYQQYNEYYRRQQLLRAYVQACGDDSYSQEEYDKRNPKSQENLRNALSDDTISNVTLKASFPISGDAFSITRDFTMNLGYDNKITASGLVGQGNDAVVVVKRGGNLTIDGTGNAGIATESDARGYAAIKMTQTGETGTETAKLTVKGGEYSAKYYAITGNGNRSGTEIVIDGGTFKGMTQSDSCAVFHPQGGNMTINSGDFSGGTTVYVKSGNIVINGGTFYADGTSAEYVLTGDGFQSTGDAFVVDNCNYPGGTPDVKIFGGTFISENANPIASYAKEGMEPLSGFVYGGRFNSQIDTSLIASGYKQVEDGDYWTVIPE